MAPTAKAKARASFLDAEREAEAVPPDEMDMLTEGLTDPNAASFGFADEANQLADESLGSKTARCSGFRLRRRGAASQAAAQA